MLAVAVAGDEEAGADDQHDGEIDGHDGQIDRGRVEDNFRVFRPTQVVQAAHEVHGVSHGGDPGENIQDGR